MKKIIYCSDNIESRWNVISDDGANNCCILVQGYEKPMRGRSSMIVLTNDLKKVYFKYSDEDQEYHAPGGGWEPNETPLHAAKRECEEEAHMFPINIKHCGTRIEYYPDDLRDWVRQHVKDPKDYWWGYYSEIFVGTYAHEYNGEIDEKDEDQFINSGDWYSVDTILKDPRLYPEYKQAILQYLKEV